MSEHEKVTGLRRNGLDAKMSYLDPVTVAALGAISAEDVCATDPRVGRQTW
ncbi:hypothetical protein NY08_3910 [Rhodococcus sp. B7740]|nr:hypothetical protein NY08_3910 [Rhodococcus sp. B7740]